MLRCKKLYKNYIIGGFFNDDEKLLRLKIQWLLKSSREVE